MRASAPIETMEIAITQTMDAVPIFGPRDWQATVFLTGICQHIHLAAALTHPPTRRQNNSTAAYQSAHRTHTTGCRVSIRGTDVNALTRLRPCRVMVLSALDLGSPGRIDVPTR